MKSNGRVGREQEKDTAGLSITDAFRISRCNRNGKFELVRWQSSTINFFGRVNCFLSKVVLRNEKYGFGGRFRSFIPSNEPLNSNTNIAVEALPSVKNVIAVLQTAFDKTIRVSPLK